ncbi:hypothetical protein CPLU01_04151 [Colletotrichum plurivorum]|uniref:Uncharacterized protein n=1 Tax=Colletotrichum plurivorum TaxID=2175906 RepID=A0A8H6NKC6_9PEZI|nr:hypothetical protein CPLU01_04151 [Colletotrichum plurivorum]
MYSSQSQAGEEIAVKDEKYRTLHLPGHGASLQYKHMLRGLPPYLRKQRPPRDVDRHRSYHAMSTLGPAQTTCSSAIIFYSRADAVRPVIHGSRRPSLAFSRLVGCVHAAVLCTIQTLYKTFSGNPSSRRVESQSRETVHNAMLSPLVDQHDPDDEGDHVPMQLAIQKPSTILSDSEGNGVASTASSLSNEADV